MILSIDIGMKNYAVCMMKYDKNDIYVESIGVYDTNIRKTDNIIMIGKKIQTLLTGIIDDDIITEVIIEKQPGKRLIMERIFDATSLYFYFTFPNCKVFYVRSDKKFCIFDIENKCKNYRDRKNLAIKIGKLFLSNNLNSYILYKFKKHDDIYDCIVMSIYLFVVHIKIKL